MKYNFLDWGLIREGGLFEGGGLIDHLRYVPKENDELLKKTITPGTANPYTLTYRKEWLSDKKRSWHVYSRKLSGGLFKACVLFDDAEQNRGIFVNRPFQHIKNSEKIYH